MNIKDALNNLMKDQEEKYSIICLVKSVTGSFCDVEPVDGSAMLLGVRLQVESSNGVLIKPQVNSKVLVSFLSKDEAFVSMFSAIDGIELNGNTWSLIKAEVFLTEIEKLKETVDALVQALNVSWTPVPNDGGAALKTVITSALIGKTTGDYSDVKNETIKHGQG